MDVDDACASFQAAVIDILCDRTAQCAGAVPRGFSAIGEARLVVAGGVAANRAIGSALAELAESHDFSFRIPPPGFAPTMRR